MSVTLDVDLIVSIARASDIFNVHFEVDICSKYNIQISNLQYTVLSGISFIL